LSQIKASEGRASNPWQSEIVSQKRPRNSSPLSHSSDVLKQSNSDGVASDPRQKASNSGSSPLLSGGGVDIDSEVTSSA
jgi:hypothetical protein